MANTFTAQFLGTGTSVGVPLIGCSCPVCKSTDPLDKRLRSSLYVTLGDQALVIDTGPDLRMQCLQWEVPRVDAVFITHLHADHIFGFDDIRRFNTIQGNQPIHCYSGPETIEGMRRIFPYISNKLNEQGLYRPLIDFVPVEDRFEALGAQFTLLPVVHGKAETNGLRIDFQGHSLAYLPDVHAIPERTLELLQGVEVLILNLLRERPHPTHLTLEQSVAYAQQIGARQTWFTHLSHDLLHATLKTLLPEGMAPAYDGLTLTLA
ncbi:MAG: MBL fold metallo-hydrolase [Kiritimatiellae bacterium]|nr:MBL fold metallo-hydrolase [Kiritimatiellia bacterium]